MGRSYSIQLCNDNSINANYFDLHLLYLSSLTSVRLANVMLEEGTEKVTRRWEKNAGGEISPELATSGEEAGPDIESRLHPFSSHNGEKVYEATDVPDTYSYRSGPRFRVIVTVIIVRVGASLS